MAWILVPRRLLDIGPVPGEGEVSDLLGQGGGVFHGGTQGRGWVPIGQTGEQRGHRDGAGLDGQQGFRTGQPRQAESQQQEGEEG